MSNPIQRFMMNTEHLKNLFISSSVLDSLNHQRQVIDSLNRSNVVQQIENIRLNFPSTVLANSIFDRLRVLDTTDRRMVEMLNSSAVAQAIQTINSSALVAHYNEIRVQFQAAIDRLSFSIDRALTPALLPLRQLAERIGEASDVRDAFCHYNLWIAPSMSEELVAKVVDLYERDVGSGTVHSMVSRYYAKDHWRRLEEIIEGCRDNPLFTSRMNLIEEAFQAHRGGLYNLSVTGLLVHLEGIAADYVKEHNLLPEVGGKTRKIILAALNDTPYSLLDVRTYAGVSALMVYVENSMFASVDFDKEHGRLHGENRLVGHAVRHGRQAAVGTRMNSLRLFLIIDVMTLLEK